MDYIYVGLATLLLLTIAASLIRILRGPTAADRMLAAQLLGTTGVAALLLLAEVQTLGALRDVALVFALLAVLATVAFVKRVWPREVQSDES